MIGPSGCGKSTLLRVLNRMYDLYPGQRAEGEVMMDGQNILSPTSTSTRCGAAIGMVFQKPTPFPMSIYDNIAFGVKLHERLSTAEMDERVEWSLTRAALWGEVKDRLQHSATGLSGGQQQRLCIARTIATRPEVILLDEPTSALDPISTLKVEELIDELKRDFTIAIVTHNMQQAARCADQVAFFYLGELVEVGRPRRCSPTRSRSAPRNTSPAVSDEQARRQGEAADMSEAARHIVTSYEQELRRLRDLLVEMGGLVESAACDRDDRRRRTGRGRRRANGGAGSGGRCPGARGGAASSFDCWPCVSRWRRICGRSWLRLKMTGDLERIGDYAANVAKRSIVLEPVQPAVSADRPGPYGAAGAGKP